MPEPAATTSTRGLATLAMLKTNFDRGRDHLSMFEPFVDDTLLSNDIDAAADSDIQRWVAERHQLTIPLSTVRTLAHRASRRGIVRREGGRYFPGSQRSDIAHDLPALRAQIENRQGELADEYQRWASERGVELQSREAALQSLVGFIERHHVRLALSDPMDELVGVDTGNDDRTVVDDDRLAARFLREVLQGKSALAETVGELLEGYVLQNTLLLADIASAERRFSGLRVFFDSGLIFGALGLHGEGQTLLTRDLITLLRAEGAKPEVFVPTVREMRRVLAIYENRIGTASGRRSLHPTDLTRHLLNANATVADVRVISATLEHSLQDLGISIVDTPAHTATYTLDELDLSARLASREGGEGDQRVVHDVDCVASVLTFRRGHSSDSLDATRAIFVTSSQLTVKNVVAWYENEEGTGVPPIAHLLTISNLTWLKRPGRAVALKLEELIALCSAVLRPSRKVWSAFVSHLDRLESSGRITSDEVTVIMASSLTDQFLSDVDIDDDPDSDSLTEVVRRVKASLGEASDAVTSEMQARIDLLQEREAQRQEVLTHRSRILGAWVSWTIAGSVGLSLIVGTLATIVNAVTGAPMAIWSSIAGLAPLAIAALLGLAWGFNVNDWRNRLGELVSAKISRWLGVESTVRSRRSDANAGMKVRE